MRQYCKKPIVIEAVQFNGTKDNLAEILRLSNSIGIYTRGVPNSLGVYTPCILSIKTLEGVMRATIGDWIIKGITGEFYPCKPDIFEATYEKV